MYALGNWLIVIVRVCCWSNGIIIDPNIRNSSMRILGKSHFGIITTAGILLLNIRIIRRTLRVISTVLGGMRPGTIFPSWMRCNYKTSRTYLDLLRNSPCPWIPACLLANAKKQYSYTKWFNVRTQKPQVTQCILTRNIVHWITLEKCL